MSRSSILPVTPFRFLFFFIKKNKITFFILFLSAICWGINEAIFPYFIKLIVNRLETYSGDRIYIYSTVENILIFLAVFWIFTEILLRLQGIIAVYLFPRFRARIRTTVFDYVKSHSYDYFANQLTGSLAKNLSDLPMSCQVLIEIIVFQFLVGMTGVVMVFFMMAQTHLIFIEVLAVWLCLHILISLVFLKYADSAWAVHSASTANLIGKMTDIFSNILSVRIFARQRYESEYLKPFQQQEIKKYIAAGWITELLRIALGLNGLALILSMIFLLLYGWVHRWVSLGDFTQVAMQSFWILGWMWYLSFQIPLFARERGVINNALRLIKKKHEIIDLPGAKPIRIEKGQIEFKNVTFFYPEHQALFENLNINILPGQRVGLVGFSGSGKTTFIHLLLRFYNLQGGRIEIDGQDIACVTQDSLRSQIAMIPQEPGLFNRSILENIQYGKLEATHEAVVTAAKLAHAHEFIEKLNGQYDAIVGERGGRLSGGQRQRIAIARAILKDAPILILDEATSALDSVTEKLIQESLHRLMRGRTSIVVAHRLSTLTNMDRILVFQKGKIIEDGSRKSLLKAKGYFAALWKTQADGFLRDMESLD